MFIDTISIIFAQRSLKNLSKIEGGFQELKVDLKIMGTFKNLIKNSKGFNVKILRGYCLF